MGILFYLFHFKSLGLSSESWQDKLNFPIIHLSNRINYTQITGLPVKEWMVVKLILLFVNGVDTLRQPLCLRLLKGNNLMWNQFILSLIEFFPHFFLDSQAFSEISGISTMFYGVRPLSPYTEYEFYVVAVNNFGRGPPSEPVTCTTGETGKIPN